MAFFGALGGALKAPLKPINKAVSKVPGLSKLQGATPGMNAMARGTGIGIQPQGQGIGPSNPALSKFGMMAQKMQQPPPVNPPPMNFQAMNQPPLDQIQSSFGGSEPNNLGASPEDIQQVGGPMPDVMPRGPMDQSAALGQGVGPRPSVFGRMAQRRPMMRGPQSY